MLNRKMNVFCLAVVIVLMLMPVTAFAGGEKEEPSATIPEKEPAPKQEPAPTTVTITDAIGREVIIKKPIERIVFTHHAVAGSIKIIGVWDMVVGREYTIAWNGI